VVAVVLSSALLVLSGSTPVTATHSFHQYSYIEEWSAPYAYTGLYTRRMETVVSGGWPAPCSAVPYSYQPVYFTQWVSINPGIDWLEIGTGHQCNPDMMYWFWGYGAGGTWYPRGDPIWTGINLNENHYFEIYRVNENWYWYINGVWRDVMYWNAVGTRVRTGMESWNGHTSTSWTTIDTINKTISEGPYTPMSYTSYRVDPQMCGTPLSGNSYRARQPVAGQAC
jgi:hypothetical protein